MTAMGSTLLLFWILSAHLTCRSWSRRESVWNLCRRKIVDDYLDKGVSASSTLLYRLQNLLSRYSIAARLFPTNCLMSDWFASLLGDQSPMTTRTWVRETSAA